VTPAGVVGRVVGGIFAYMACLEAHNAALAAAVAASACQLEDMEGGDGTIPVGVPMISSNLAASSSKAKAIMIFFFISVILWLWFLRSAWSHSYWVLGAHCSAMLVVFVVAGFTMASVTATAAELARAEVARVEKQPLL